MTQNEINTKLAEISKAFQVKNLQNQAQLEKLLFSLYNNQSQKIIGLLASGEVEFSDIKIINTALDTVRNTLNLKTSEAITKSVDKSIQLGISSVKGQLTVFKNSLPVEIVEKEIIPSVFNRVSFDAADAMAKLKDGLTASDKIWNINLTSLDQMRAYMMQSMIEGKDFAEVYQQIKSFLVLPDVDLRTKKWLQFFKDNPPGKGVYRSAWKNVLRLLRTETNRAFREALKQYAKQRVWVQGIKWMLSDAHPEMDECNFFASDDLYGLGPGVYTPEGVPDEHPQGICYLVMVPNYEYIGVQF